MWIDCDGGKWCCRWWGYDGVWVFGVLYDWGQSWSRGNGGEGGRRDVRGMCSHGAKWYCEYEMGEEGSL